MKVLKTKASHLAVTSTQIDDASNIFTTAYKVLNDMSETQRLDAAFGE